MGHQGTTANLGDGATVQPVEVEEAGREDGGEDEGDTVRGEQVKEVTHGVYPSSLRFYQRIARIKFPLWCIV